MRMKNKILLIASILALIGCQTTPIAPTGSFQKGKWETMAQINELKPKKTHRVSIDILAVKNEKMRMEITATLGYRVASILLDREGYKAAIYPQKKFYQGTDENAFAQVSKLPISSRALFSIVFDEPIVGPGWACGKETATLPKKCVQASSRIQVEWFKKPNGAKLVKVTSPKVEMNWFFQNPDVNFAEKPELFNLNVPEGYQVIGAESQVQ